MGSVVGCLKKSQPNENPLLKDKIVLSVGSTRLNDSSTSTVLSLNQHVPNNFRMEFNWSKMQTIYLGCPSSLNDDLNLTLPMVRVVENVFEVLEGNLITNSKKIQFCISFLGKEFRSKFKPNVGHLKNEFKCKSLDEKILAHVITYVKFHKMLLYLFGSNIDEARRCLNLLAYSHSAANITQTDFRMFDIAVEKFLLKFQVLGDDDLKVVVSYFNLITNYICNYIHQNNANSSVNELICTEAVLKKNDSSRQLRRWNRLVGKLRYETCSYIEEALELNQTEIAQPSTSMDANKKLCPLSSIDCIFRGNKR